MKSQSDKPIKEVVNVIDELKSREETCEICQRIARYGDVELDCESCTDSFAKKVKEYCPMHDLTKVSSDKAVCRSCFYFESCKEGILTTKEMEQQNEAYLKSLGKSLGKCVRFIEETK